jgi:hypothetical protein
MKLIPNYAALADGKNIVFVDIGRGMRTLFCGHLNEVDGVVDKRLETSKERVWYALTC